MACRKVLLYLVGIPYISTNSSTLFGPTILGGGSHVQKPRPAQPPTPRKPPGPWLSSGHVDVASTVDVPPEDISGSKP